MTRVNELLQQYIASGSICVILLLLVLIIGESNNYRSVLFKMLTSTSILTPSEIILSEKSKVILSERRAKFPDKSNVFKD